MPNVVSAIKMLHDLGNKGTERSILRYGGHSKLDPSMKKYDGVGYAPVKHNSSMEPCLPCKRAAGRLFCSDSRTSALFIAEPFDLGLRRF